ncbi:hypothetical protein KKA03_05050, partial [archaeon]|nr:hypothetical protein [archaeon]
GSEACQTCHAEKYEDWSNSGHPYKLMTPDEAKAIRPDMPVPEGYTWDDIQYVIGGWGWKSRYIGLDGYIITKKKDGTPLEANQYNWQDGSWSAYHAGEDKLVYNCQKCHNTGAAYAEGTHQDDLEGIEGTWEERGVGCEACHGPGSEHVAQGGGKEVAIVVDKTSELCGLCHIRGDTSKIPASGGFIQHHEQYQEIENGGMSSLTCDTCHDPHKAVHNGATNTEGKPGIIKECEECHAENADALATSTMGKAGVLCNDCHMPKVTKSAIKVAEFVGDVKTHIFRIDTSADAKMFTEDGKAANGYLTLDFACLGCHEDRDQAWAASYTEGIHSLVKVVETPAPTAPATTPAPKGGICGPTAVLLFAMLPATLYGLKRRR